MVPLAPSPAAPWSGAGRAAAAAPAHAPASGRSGSATTNLGTVSNPLSEQPNVFVQNIWATLRNYETNNFRRPSLYLQPNLHLRMISKCNSRVGVTKTSGLNRRRIPDSEESMLGFHLIEQDRWAKFAAIDEPHYCTEVRKGQGMTLHISESAKKEPQVGQRNFPC